MTEAEDRPLLRVVRGAPTADELAALVAVVSARAASQGRGGARPRSAWAGRDRLLRQVPTPGPDAWRRSGWPR
jgi:hypothetical protein